MKYLQPIIITLLLMMSIPHYAQAQSTDSIATQKARSLQQQLLLSNNQCSDIKNIYITMLNSKNNLSLSTINTNNRTIQLKKINENYQTALQQILTAEQWNQYEILCNQTRSKIEQHLQKQQINYHFLTH